MKLQILSYNIHKGIGWRVTPTTIHSIQSKIQESHSDIIFLQEVRGIHCDLLRSHLSPYVAFGENSTYRKGSHGNVILSKLPIVYFENIDISMHRFERRGVLHSIIQHHEMNLPIHLLCTHLGLFSSDRRKQLDIIVKYINDNIPRHEPVILGGDFNDWTGYATEPLVQNLEFQEAFLNKHASYAKTFPMWLPILKLDRMYFRGFNVNYASRLIHKSWRYLSDHIAIEVSLNLVI